MKNSKQQILLDQVFVISNKIKVLLSVVTLTQPLLLQLSQNRIYYCYSMQLKKITKYRMLCRTQFDRMCWFPKLTLCCWPRRKQIVSTMYKNNIFNCFTWVKIEWWLFIGIYMVTFMTPLSLTDNIDITFSMLNLHGAPWKVAISMMWFILASNLIILSFFFVKIGIHCHSKRKPRMQFERQQIYFLYFPSVAY